MLLLGGILLAVFVVPWPWGVVTVAVGGLLDIGESFAFVKWSRRRRATGGGERLVGQTAVVATGTQVRGAGELWGGRRDEPVRAGDEVGGEAVDGPHTAGRRRGPR